MRASWPHASQLQMSAVAVEGIRRARRSAAGQHRLGAARRRAAHDISPPSSPPAPPSMLAATVSDDSVKLPACVAGSVIHRRRSSGAALSRVSWAVNKGVAVCSRGQWRANGPQDLKTRLTNLMVRSVAAEWQHAHDRGREFAQTTKRSPSGRTASLHHRPSSAPDILPN